MKKAVLPVNLIIGVISLLLLIAGVAIRPGFRKLSNYMLISVFILGGLHWVWSIIDVSRDKRLKSGENRPFWLTIVIILAPIGGILYYLMQRKQVNF